jgi:hypothetical protein
MKTELDIKKIRRNDLDLNVCFNLLLFFWNAIWHINDTGA